MTIRHIHEHEVFKWMLLSDRVFTPQELVEEITAEFGPHARFYNCTVKGMSPDEMVETMDRNGNFLIVSDGFLKTTS